MDIELSTGIRQVGDPYSKLSSNIMEIRSLSRKKRSIFNSRISAWWMPSVLMIYCVTVSFVTMYLGTDECFARQVVDVAVDLQMEWL